MRLESNVLGKGEPLLFLAGAFTTFKYYEKFLRLLSKKYKVYFFNYPGFEKSEPFPDGHTLKNYIKTIDYFVKDKKLQKFHLAGHSFGGLLAVHYCHLRKGKDIKSLILLSPQAKLGSKTKLKSAFIIIKENLTEKLIHRNYVLTMNSLNPYNFHNIKQKWEHGNLVFTCGLDKRQVPSKTPVLMVVGAKDNLVDVDYAVSIFKGKNKNVKVVKLEGVGHDAFALIGDRILDIVKNFTDNLRK